MRLLPVIEEIKMTEQPRQLAGRPTGGQFAAVERPDGEASLAPTCARCGGPWGADTTCANCTDEDGAPREPAGVNYNLGPGAVTIYEVADRVMDSYFPGDAAHLPRAQVREAVAQAALDVGKLHERAELEGNGRPEKARAHQFPGHVADQVHAKLDELGWGADEPMLMVPEDGFHADDYIDIVAYDGGTGRLVKFTRDPEGSLEVVVDTGAGR